MTGQIILIEGTDGTGKTTLARELAAQAGSRTAVFHAGAPENKAYLNEYILPLTIASDGWTCICDRWHLGEPVWAKVFGRKPILTVEQLHIVEKRLQAFDVEIAPIYLERSEAEIVAELDRRAGQMTRVGASIEAIQEYEHAMRFSLFYWHRTTLPEALAELKGDADGA
jgi:tRNA A37 N6-isopentenylltransferase MiaA